MAEIADASEKNRLYREAIIVALSKAYITSKLFIQL